MKLYSENENYKLYHGSMLDMLEVIEPNSIDSIVTDPPYGLTSITKRFGKENSAEAQFGSDGAFKRLSKGFMGKEWDGSGIEYNINTWRKCYEVLKPGGYLLAFGGTRTFHRIACAIEDAGFEIRDTIMWLYGSGFPKSLNIGLAIDKKNGVESEVIARVKGSGSTGINERGNQQFVAKNQYKDGTYDLKKATNEWAGWGTALKPAYEPIIVARKPVEDSVVNNVLKYGVGGINIDECRVGNEEVSTHLAPKGTFAGGDLNRGSTREDDGSIKYESHSGRYPSNIIHDGSDEVIKGMPDTFSTDNIRYNNNSITSNKGIYGKFNDTESYGYDDEGSASRYFYCAKASKKDRDEGLDMFEEKQVNDGRQTPIDNAFQRGETPKKNIHPTVKPVELMQYLVRLVSPKGATILDPFNGSGSTGKAVMFENKERDANYKYIGIELTEEYLPIAKTRIEYAEKCDMIQFYTEDIIDGEKKKIKIEQQSIFDLLN